MRKHMINNAIKGDIRNNAEMKIVLEHLCLFATKDIAVNEELRFDYGVPNLPWRKAGEDLVNHEGNAITNVESQKDTTSLADEDVVYQDNKSPRTVDSWNNTLADQDMIHKLENDARPVDQCQAKVEADEDVVYQDGNSLRTVDSQNDMLAEEKVRQEARQVTDRLKEEKQQEMGLRQLEEEWRLVEEAERQKKEAASRKQRKQGSGSGGKSSSKSPSPLSAGPGTPQKGQEVKTGPDRVTPVGRTIRYRGEANTKMSNRHFK
ncbi:uncharacterized protein LOC127864032 isoform X4 [Dreissena polymorpha]|uniref:uncharacterized protein LOC127864032 isoform X3 n=1 Tax=Dreissena polymorpha TaxID=45954 RepID=UPI0022650446|nr:uncharacterized protein LOC127864032 isoform X3 [Dreissena polymorpha]XP_052259669.1 uncharacterized protein LOC127864032 isoform X4 [Dreissena polymorpha]